MPPPNVREMGEEEKRREESALLLLLFSPPPPPPPPQLVRERGGERKWELQAVTSILSPLPEEERYCISRLSPPVILEKKIFWNFLCVLLNGVGFFLPEEKKKAVRETDRDSDQTSSSNSKWRSSLLREKKRGGGVLPIKDRLVTGARG